MCAAREQQASPHLCFGGTIGLLASLQPACQPTTEERKSRQLPSTALPKDGLPPRTEPAARTCQPTTKKCGNRNCPGSRRCLAAWERQVMLWHWATACRERRRAGGRRTVGAGGAGSCRGSTGSPHTTPPAAGCGGGSSSSSVGGRFSRLARCVPCTGIPCGALKPPQTPPRPHAHPTCR